MILVVAGGIRWWGTAAEIVQPPTASPHAESPQVVPGEVRTRPSTGPAFLGRNRRASESASAWENVLAACPDRVRAIPAERWVISSAAPFGGDDDALLYAAALDGDWRVLVRGMGGSCYPNWERDWLGPAVVLDLSTISGMDGIAGANGCGVHVMVASGLGLVTVAETDCELAVFFLDDTGARVVTVPIVGDAPLVTDEITASDFDAIAPATPTLAQLDVVRRHQHELRGLLKLGMNSEVVGSEIERLDLLICRFDPQHCQK